MPVPDLNGVEEALQYRNLYEDAGNELGPLYVEDWMIDDWSVYRFNFSGASSPAIGEVSGLKSLELSCALSDKFALYKLKMTRQEDAHAISLANHVIVLAISFVEPEHAFAELKSFLHYYVETECDLDVAIYGPIIREMPWIGNIVQNFIGRDKVVILDDDASYFIEEGYIRRNDHLALSLDWPPPRLRSAPDVLEPQGKAAVTFEDWLLNSEWRVYKFNYVNSPVPPIGEINLLESHFIKLEVIDHVILYCSSKRGIGVFEEEVDYIDEDVFFLNISTTNPGHSLSELNSFYNFYIGQKLEIPVVVPSILRQKLPFIWELIFRLFEGRTIIELSNSKSCLYRRAFFRRNVHLNYFENWEQIKFKHTAGCLEFRDAFLHLSDLADDPGPLMEISRSSALRRSHTRDFSRIVMLAKLQGDGPMITPARGLVLREDARQNLVEHGIKIVSLSDFADLDDYLATLKLADVLITSFGAVACTNRFFVAPSSRVLLLANRSYGDEFNKRSYFDAIDEEGEESLFSFIRATHVYPSKCQRVLLDFNDTVTVDDAIQIISNVKYLLEFS